ncbi:tectonic-1 [Boleophthalmus pectinirostris]|uniref:tectonic-1 n=1 Tax=Boleophthalmus pectinirostris TaxID=150288 RepID=UPI00242D1542|nr:tectonic-1 [Boleophthalmus pectinirostris]
MASFYALFYLMLVNIVINNKLIASENNTSYNLSTTVYPDQNNTFNITDVYTPTEPTQFESTTRISTTTSSISTEPPEPDLPEDPLPLSGQLLQPATSVALVCPCDMDKDMCDINCCCDKECGPELALFTSCSVNTVRGSKRLCNQDVASYSLSTTIDGYSELQSSVQNDKNYDPFCIYFANRIEGLYHHPPPALPTDRNFDSLFEKFTSFTFSPDSGQGSATEPQTSPGYQYGDIMQTTVANGQRDIFYLPSSGITMDCVDRNPAAFLNKQNNRCSRRVDLQQDCESLPALSIDTYINIQVLSGKSIDATLVPVEVASIVMQSLEGAQIEVQFSEGDFLPVLLNPSLCAYVVLEVAYVVKYNSAGEIVNVAASLVLGYVQDTPMSFEQIFEMRFSEDNGLKVAVQFSGNPGYVVGLPLMSAYKTPEGLSRSINPKDTLSLLQSSIDQDCLQGPQLRSQILFGHDSVTGCTLRLADVTNCRLISQVLLDILRGQNYPQFVASFGNSPIEKSLDWVAIKRTFNPQDSEGCGIPLSLHLEIEWTKYGTLVNPQAQIVSVKEIIHTNTSELALLSGGSAVLPVQTSVAFISVSAPATPRYRVMPTIDAKLPFDFLFPFE